MGIGGFANLQSDKGSIDVGAQYIDGRSNFAEVDLALSGAVDTAFAVRSAETDGSGGLLSVAGEYEIATGVSVNANLRGFFADDQQTLSASVGVGWRF